MTQRDAARSDSVSADVYFGFQPNCDFALLVSITTDARATCSHSRADGTNGTAR